MATEINDQEFIDFCKTATPIEVVEKVTEGNIRGLDKLALQNLSSRGHLPDEVENILVAYFFKEFANKVYNRTHLRKLYDHWVANKVTTVQKAEEMIKKDIYTILGN